MCNSNVPCDWSVRCLCRHCDGFLLGKLFGKHPKNHWRYDSADILLGSCSISFCMFLHYDHRSQKPRFDELADKGRSRASILRFWWRQTTKLHPIPAHPRLAPVTNSLWPWVGRLPFFEHLFQGVARNVIGSRNAAHTRSFVIGRQNLLFFCLAPLVLRIHNRWFMASLAQELLTACAVFAILDNIGAIALGTVEDYRFADHLPFISPFTKNHYRFSIVNVPSILLWTNSVVKCCLGETDLY